MTIYFDFKTIRELIGDNINQLNSFINVTIDFRII